MITLEINNASDRSDLVAILSTHGYTVRQRRERDGYYEYKHFVEFWENDNGDDKND